MDTLRLENVSKSFGQSEAVKNLSFGVEPGTILGFLGPNGAGKTTTLRMIMEVILPDTGAIYINGQPNSLQVRDRVGYLPEERGMYRRMKVHEAFTFFGELKGLSAKEATARIAPLLERFGMSEVRDKKMEELSKGNQQKIQFLTTILHEPDLLIMDEPFMGLDPIGAELVKNTMLEQRKRGAAIIFSTHLMEQAEKLCDTICLINKGEKVLGGKVSEVKKNFGKQTVLLAGSGDFGFLEGSVFAKHYNRTNQHFEVTLQDKVAPRQFLAEALQHVDVSHFEVAEPSLHEIFLTVVKSN